MNQKKIQSHKCSHPIAVQDILAYQLEEKIKEKYYNMHNYGTERFYQERY